MALNGTYAGLQASIAATLARDDLADAIKDWIALCEDDLRTSLGIHDQEKVATLTISSSDTVLPPNFNAQRSCVLNSGTNNSNRSIVLDFVTPAEMAELYPYSITGIPRVFTVKNQTLTVAPIPDIPYIATLTYMENVPSLSDVNNSNYILINYPRAYLYGSLVHSAPYIGGAADARLPMWEQFRNEAVADMINNDIQYRYGGGKPGVSSDYIFGGWNVY